MEIITSWDGWLFLLRWLHFLAGITWIGILYYFNFVQTPFLATDLGGQARSQLTRGLVPDALWWFRWGAMFTFLAGWFIVFIKLHQGIPLDGSYMTKILTGGLMGTLMWANVWFVIWPAQQVVIANAEAVAGGGEANPAAAGRGARAGMASRTNTLFSIPMLFFMASASHAGWFGGGADAGGGVASYWIAAIVVIALVEYNALIGPGATTQKPLTTVSGTIHGGLAVSLVLYLLGVILI
jgi:uncharacterized membrane protein